MKSPQRPVKRPQNEVAATIDALTAKLQAVTIGDPRLEDVDMGALISAEQKADVLAVAEQLAKQSTRVYGEDTVKSLVGEQINEGAFVSPMVFRCDDPDGASTVHDLEAFGPVSTVMGYRDLEHAIELANRGQGSLVASVFTRDGKVAKTITLGAAAYHGRLYFNNRDSMAESTGHGSPLPHMTHGGPGRAGGGEEMGGVRGVMHYMQRTAVQASPDLMTAITGQWVPGSTEVDNAAHPFTRTFHELFIGETLHTAERVITIDDIEQFAHFTGDTFYAHMDDAAAKRNPFFPGRVAHGYLLLSFAAGLFVQPDEGPVLANTGLDHLRFLNPVSAGDAIKVRLTVKQKTPRNAEYGEVRWQVNLSNQNDEPVASYELLTMNAF